MDAGNLVSPDLTCQVLIGAMLENPSEHYLLDGFPRSIEQAEVFEDMIGKVNRVLYFEVPKQVMMERCLSRGQTSGRSDDNSKVIQNRIDTYFNETQPIVMNLLGKNYRICRVDQGQATQGIDEVYQ